MKITIELENGKVLTAAFDTAGNAVKLTTPTMPGDHTIVLNAPAAPTPDKVADNPGAFVDWEDVTTARLPNVWFDASKDGEYNNLGFYPNFAAFYLDKPADALRWFRQFHMGHDLNLSRLTDDQKRRLHIAV